MLRTKRMTKVRITGPRTSLQSIIRLLHRLKLVHLLDHLKTEKLDIGSPLADGERVSALLVKVRSFLSSIGDVEVASENITDDVSLDQLEDRFDHAVDAHNTVHERLTELHETIVEKEAIVKELELLVGLGFDANVMEPFSHLRLFIGNVADIEGLEKVLPQATFAHTIHEEKDVVGVLVAHKHVDKVEKVLQSRGFSPLVFSDLTSYHGDIKEHIRKLHLSLDLLQKDLIHADEQQQNVVRECAPFLLGLDHYLRAESEKTQAPLRFAETKYAFVTQGWVSTEEYQHLKKALEKETKKKVFVEILPVTVKDKIPVVMKNMFFVKPFEFFMHLYTLPSYKEMDPSFFLFWTFPFFFGLMLGDVAYGLITLLLFAFLAWKMPQGRNLLKAMMLCSVVTIFFGFVFGEYLGFESVGPETADFLTQFGIPLHEEVIHGHTVYSFPRLMNRLHSTMNILGNTLPTVLVIGSLLGFLHVNLGLFLGFINELHSHGFKHAFFAKISWYVLELGVALAALGGLGMVPLHWGVGLAVVILAAVMLYIGEGVQGIVEIPAIFTNILSYLRIGAVALASVGLAVVVNEKLALPFVEQGGWYIAVGLFIMVIGHGVNIALGVIGPFLHSLRLHYVEFFSKFYHGGGTRFIAFGEEGEAK
jgi:V/A-type H+/Na+-transporting ATPase subunit I